MAKSSIRLTRKSLRRRSLGLSSTLADQARELNAQGALVHS
jgi:hypothetical protein